MRDTRRFVESRLQDFSAPWNGEARFAREEIAKHVRKITLKPVFRTYVATGIWDWLGVMGSAAVMVVPGDRHARYCQVLSSLLTWLRKRKNSGGSGQMDRFAALTGVLQKSTAYQCAPGQDARRVRGALLVVEQFR
jgi:hypothetical protein